MNIPKEENQLITPERGRCSNWENGTSGFIHTGRAAGGAMAQGALRRLRAGRVLRGLRSAIGTESCDPSGWPAQDRVSPQVQSQVPGQGPLPRPEDPQLVATSLWEQKGQAKNPPVGSSGPVWGPARAGLGEPPSWLTARSVLTAGLKAAINQLEVTVPHSVLSSASRTLQPIPSALLCFPGLPCGFPSWRAQGQPRAPS